MANSDYTGNDDNEQEREEEAAPSHPLGEARSESRRVMEYREPPPWIAGEVEAPSRDSRDEFQARVRASRTRLQEPRVGDQPQGREDQQPRSRSSTPVRRHQERDGSEVEEEHPRWYHEEQEARTSVQRRMEKESRGDVAMLFRERQPTQGIRDWGSMAPSRPRPEDDLYDEGVPHYQIGRRPSVGQGWTIDVPDHLGQKGRDSMREQLDRIWDEFRAEQPLPPTPQAAPPPHLTRRYEDGREEQRPRWREPQHITRVPEVPEDVLTQNFSSMSLHILSTSIPLRNPFSIHSKKVFKGPCSRHLNMIDTWFGPDHPEATAKAVYLVLNSRSDSCP